MRKGNKLIQEGKVPKKRTLNTQVLTDIVNSYYLDGIETGYKAGYDYGYEEGYRQHGQDFVADGEKAYQKGLEDGKQGVAIDGDKRYWDGYHAAQEDGQKIYKKGLYDAWAAARKLCQSEKYGGYEEHCAEIFNRKDMFDVFDYSASEAIEKIREFEEKQKQDCDTCIYNDKEWHSEPCDGCTLSDSHYVSADDPIESEKADSPCDLCRFNPPSAGDGKPCTMCPAEGRSE